MSAANVFIRRKAKLKIDQTLHQDSKAVFADPDKFRHERWFEEDTKERSNLSAWLPGHASDEVWRSTNYRLSPPRFYTGTISDWQIRHR